jgi:hypothetical protein
MEGLRNRAVSLIVCAALVVVGWFGGNAVESSMSGGFLTAQAANVRAKATVMQIGGQDVAASNYLYWLTYACDLYYQYYGITDWTLEATTDLTVGDLAKEQADFYITQYVAIELLADEMGVTLTDEQQEIVSSLAETNAELYGEDLYQYELTYAGLNDALMERYSSVPYLYRNLCEVLLAEGGALEPTEENLQAFAENNGYTDLDDETLLSYYEDTSYGAPYDYVQDYIDALEVTKTSLYDSIDVSTYYPALLELRDALAVPDVEETTIVDDSAEEASTED